MWVARRPAVLCALDLTHRVTRAHYWRPREIMGCKVGRLSDKEARSTRSGSLGPLLLALRLIEHTKAQGGADVAEHQRQHFSVRWPSIGRSCSA